MKVTHDDEIAKLRASLGQASSEEIERLKSAKNVNNERIKELEDVAERNGKTIQSLKNELVQKNYEIGLLNIKEKEEDRKSRRSLMSSILNKKNDTAQGNFQGNEFKT